MFSYTCDKYSVVKSPLPWFSFSVVSCEEMHKPSRQKTTRKHHHSPSLWRWAQINTTLTTPMGKARTAIIQSRREMSFFICLSCSWLSFPFVRRLERSVNTQIPKKTAWITCIEMGTHLQQWKHQTLAESRGRIRCRWGIAPQNWHGEWGNIPCFTMSRICSRET